MQTVLLSSAYMPPVSFMSAAAAASEVLIEQHDSYCKQTYRNRCVIASAAGPLTLTVPTVRPDSPGQAMKDVRISDHGDWRRQHWNALESAYMHTPFFMYYADEFRPFYERKWDFLLDYNMEMTELILKLAGLDIRLSLTDSYCTAGSDSGISDLRRWIEPSVCATEYPGQRPYWQVFKQKYGFLPNLSSIDLLFNMGPEFRSYL